MEATTSDRLAAGRSSGQLAPKELKQAEQLISDQSTNLDILQKVVIRLRSVRNGLFGQTATPIDSRGDPAKPCAVGAHGRMCELKTATGNSLAEAHQLLDEIERFV